MKIKSQELGQKAATEAEKYADEIKTRFNDITSKLKKIQEGIEEVQAEGGEESGVKAGVALSALKARLQEAMILLDEAIADYADYGTSLGLDIWSRVCRDAPDHYRCK